MKFYLDTEFKEKPHTIDLISIGIVSGGGKEYYAISKDFNLKEAWQDEWLRSNVLETIHQELCEKVEVYARTYYWKLFEPFTMRSLRNLLKWHGKTNAEIAKEVLYFCSNGYFDNTGLDLKEAVEYELHGNFKPEFYGYYADYDWVVFCWLFGRMLDLPKGFPMYCQDLKQMMDENGLSKKWTEKHCPKPQNEHNALADAHWHKSIHEAILGLDLRKSALDWKKKYEEKARQKMNLEKQLDTANKKLIDAGLKKPAIVKDASHNA